jgi:hypothetical protein
MSYFSTFSAVNSLTTVIGTNKPYVPPILPQATAWYKFNINTDICGNSPWLYLNYANGLYDASFNNYGLLFPPAGNCFLTSKPPPSLTISPSSYYTTGTGGTSGNYSKLCIQNKISTSSTGFTICYWYSAASLNNNGHPILNLTGGTGGSVTQLAIFLSNSPNLNAISCQINSTSYSFGISSVGTITNWNHHALVCTPIDASTTLLTFYRNSVQIYNTVITQAMNANITFASSQLGMLRSGATYCSDFRCFPNVLSINDIYSIYIFKN